MDFEWDAGKNTQNIHKHELSFEEAQQAFFDKNRIILADPKHSAAEQRYYCIGKTKDGGDSHRSIYEKRPQYKNYRRRILARRKENL